MKTAVRKIGKEELNTAEGRQILAEAGALLRAGELVAFPTETVYGLGADALQPEAAKKIYAAKGRPSDNPLIVHIADISSLSRIAEEVPEAARLLADAFWPGPLTMILKKSAEVPRETTGGLDTVAVRMPEHPAALALIRAAGGFVAAPSANTSGRPSPTRAEHVYEDLNGKIPLILDGGEVGIGLESTIVDLSVDIPTILRPGYITEEMVREAAGAARTDPGLISENSKEPPKAPGMKYRHYAPKAEMTLVSGEEEAVVAKICSLAEESRKQGKRVGILVESGTAGKYREKLAKLRGGEGNSPLPSAGPGEVRGAGTGVKISGRAKQPCEILIRSAGSRQDDEEIARNLYALLREFDALGVDVIYSECFDTPRMGQAIMNRMRKAAGQRVIEAGDET